MAQSKTCSCKMCNARNSCISAEDGSCSRYNDNKIKTRPLALTPRTSTMSFTCSVLCMQPAGLSIIISISNSRLMGHLFYSTSNFINRWWRAIPATKNVLGYQRVHCGMHRFTTFGMAPFHVLAKGARVSRSLLVYIDSETEPFCTLLGHFKTQEIQSPSIDIIGLPVWPRRNWEIKLNFRKLVQARF